VKRQWPIIAVADVTKSAAWYVTLLRARENHPGATVFNQILDADGTVLLCLHHWGPSGPAAITIGLLSRTRERVAQGMASCFGSL
jgi:hypothetical protein